MYFINLILFRFFDFIARKDFKMIWFVNLSVDFSRVYLGHSLTTFTIVTVKTAIVSQKLENKVVLSEYFNIEK
jgi:hypothetical protein